MTLPPLLDDAVVEVWIAALDELPTAGPALWATLDDGERRKAQAFYFPRDRQRFVSGRAVLRLLLARYLQTEPQRITLQYGPHGKPALPRECAHDLSFNLSHSDGLAVYPFARGRRVGVDVERVREDGVAIDEIARRAFTPGEVRTLAALPAAVRLQAFFAGWTRKEAYLKARGDGLNFPLDRFEVSLAPDDPPRLLEVHGEPAESERWSLATLETPWGYAAAVAVEGHGWRLRCRRWGDD